MMKLANPIFSGLAVVVVLVLTGCTNSAQHEGTPSATASTSSDRSQIEKMVACVRAAGFDATVTGDKSMSVASVPQDQQSALIAAQDACQTKLRVFQYKQLSSSDYDKLYSETLQTVACLEGQGYSLPTPPSRQVFEQTYKTNPYLPYGIIRPDATTFKTLSSICPEPDV